MAELGLRDRKKKEMRQHISDVATRMFLEQGFDNVRVSDVAEECGVSEKTVFNYFKNKEALALDQEEPMVERLRERLGPGAKDAPADAMNDLVDETVEKMIGHGLGGSHMEEMIGKFMRMIESTPSLAAARDGATKRLIDTAVQALSERFARDPEDAEIHVIANALVGFWDAGRTRALHHARNGKSPEQIRKLTRNDMDKAAQLIHHGIDGALMGNTIGGPHKRKASARK